ncbi:hypothetical protein [Lactiplantibacillus plantarum]|uniref:hypothetical protein n=1 Tax=Lactiplantibacillus plantarum TaxID=1590 RepID=UPI0015E07B42|nr:hypothetical protein [Lactiplantibacillus plantarum]
MNIFSEIGTRRALASKAEARLSLILVNQALYCYQAQPTPAQRLLTVLILPDLKHLLFLTSLNNPTGNLLFN